MFGRIGAFSIRYRWFVIVFWLALAAALAVLAPPLSKVGVTDQEVFLPADAQSVLDGKRFQQEFPEDSTPGDTIVFFRAAGLTEADLDYARQAEAWLESPQAPEEVAEVVSIFDRLELEPLMKSPDGTTMLMSVNFTTAISAEPTFRAVDRIREYLSSAPAGLQVYTAGSASVARDTLETVVESLDRTTWATVILVIVVLLVIYRSPVASLVPLLTIGLAYLVSRGALGYLAEAGLQLPAQMDIFAVVVVFGVGTDYCLFMVSRYREELHELPTQFEAGVRTMEKIGAVIAASATVVILAFLFLNVAGFGMTRTVGTGLAVTIFITLTAGLTLTPALMSVAGRNLFWPFAHQRERPEAGYWHRLASWVSRNAAWLAPAIIAVLLLPYIFLPQLQRSFDLLADIPASMPSVKGFDTLKGHFDPGTLFPTTVVLDAEGGEIRDHLQETAALVKRLREMPGVARVRSLLTPTGDPEAEQLFLVDAQLKGMAQQIGQVIGAFTSGKGATPEGMDAGAALKAMQDYLTELGAKYPEVKDAEAYRNAVAKAGAVAQAVSRLQSATQVVPQLQMIAEQIGSLAQNLQSPRDAPSPDALAEQAAGLNALENYLTGLAEKYPFVKDEAAYTGAVDSLTALKSSLAGLQKAMLVSGQLDLIAAKMDETAKALDNPMALVGSNIGDELSSLQSYLGDLAGRFPWAASEESFQSAQAHLAAIAQAALRLQGGQVPMSDLPTALAGLKTELAGTADSLRTLAAAFAQRDPQAVFVPSETLAGLAQPKDVAAQAEAFGLHLLELSKVFEAREPDATYMASGLPVQGNVAQLVGDLGALAGSLDTLSGEFAGKQAYLYSDSLMSLYPGAEGLGKAFISPDGSATRMYVILQPEPYSNEALDLSVEVRSAADEYAEGVSLTAYVTGSSIAFADIRQISSEDFTKVLLLTSLGVFVVMMLLLRSVVAPIYLVLTVLLSYGTTMSLTALVFQALLDQGGVNLMIPTLVLVLLVALGADYNIFLMSRVREETAGRDFTEGLVRATTRTGAIITSCGIVLAGTFATMTLSPMMLLLQVGAAVAFGVLLDTFVIRGMLVPAIAKLLGKANWWPTRNG